VLRRATSNLPPSPGSLRVVTDAFLRDRYVMTEDIAGQGLSGAVSIIIDKKTRQRRVLKSICWAGKEDEDRDALLNEMDVYLKLDHPNICRLLEVYVEDDTCHLVMEMCTGKDLCDRWEARGRYTEQDTRELVAQMLAAVSYMHSKGIAHRDLKLENWVFADPSDNARLKLIDFGFSELMNPDAPFVAILGTIFYVAPEVLEREYDLKCDTWSIGVITHMLLSGHPPFGTFTDDDDAIFGKILSGDGATMDGPEWLDVSEEARDFVSRLLTRDPVMRPSAQDAAAHPWLQKVDGPHQTAHEVDVSVLESLRSFASMNVLKRTAYGLITASTSACETDSLEGQFKMLGAKNRGTISMNELVEALKEHLGMSEDDARELFGRLDLAGDGHINYSEFLAATAQRKILEEEKLFRLAFDRFDTDHSGVISQENLQEVLGNSYMGLKPEDIIHQINQDGDDVIKYEDFLKAMMDLGCADNSLPCSTERVKNISRAFSIISPEADYRPRPSPLGPRALQRGWHTPDAEDALQEQVDEDYARDLARACIAELPVHPWGSRQISWPVPQGRRGAVPRGPKRYSEEQFSRASWQLRCESRHCSDKE
jgi:calcium-dependent protein kinase